MKRRALITILALLIASTGNAQSESTIKAVNLSTHCLCLVPSATGFIKAIAEKDKIGIHQLGVSTMTTFALNYTLEACITKERPDGTGMHSFPSTHTAVSFDGATFLMRRYGWKWGVPAYVVSTYVGWGRVFAQKHDWWDVLGGAAIGAGSALIFTRPFAKKVNLTIAPASFSNGCHGLYASIKF